MVGARPERAKRAKARPERAMARPDRARRAMARPERAKRPSKELAPSAMMLVPVAYAGKVERVGALLAKGRPPGWCDNQQYVPVSIVRKSVIFTHSVSIRNCQPRIFCVSFSSLLRRAIRGGLRRAVVG